MIAIFLQSATESGCSAGLPGFGLPQRLENQERSGGSSRRDEIRGDFSLDRDGVIIRHVFHLVDEIFWLGLVNETLVLQRPTR